MKTTTLFVLLFTTFSIIAQEKFTTNSGVINFEASVPFLEEIKAVNSTVAINLDTKTNSFLCTVIMKDFIFDLDLMQQHFNENYIESERYPKAVFKGKIADLDIKELTAVEKEYLIIGKLYIHGKLKQIEVKAQIKKVNEGIQVTSNFPITIADFDIQIPEKVASKIAKTANTNLISVLRSDNIVYVTLK